MQIYFKNSLIRADKIAMGTRYNNLIAEPSSSLLIFTYSAVHLFQSCLCL